MVVVQSLTKAGRGVWITRAEPGAGATAKRVIMLGLQPMVAPLLVVHPQTAIFDLEPFETLAFTSSQGLLHLPSGISRDRRVFAVGDTTADAARQAGFKEVICASGDVDELAVLILRERPPAVVHLAADKTAGDLVGALTAAGLLARRVTIYRTEAAKALPKDVVQAVKGDALAAMLIHSPRAGVIAASLIAQEALDMARVRAFGLSAACVRPLGGTGFEGLMAAATPTESSLLGLLADSLS